jgi:hypothetical protein
MTRPVPTLIISSRSTPGMTCGPRHETISGRSRSNESGNFRIQYGSRQTPSFWQLPVLGPPEPIRCPAVAAGLQRYG